MIDLKDFQDRKSLLERWYDRVLTAHELLQADDVTLREAKAYLHADRFIVAVCGQMNSGKSTLLNALLFGHAVLPSASTTTTAKITLLEGSAQESVEGTLYTPDEFQSVVDESNKDSHAAADLSSARESARSAGLQESQLITDPARIERRLGLDELSRFAAVSGKGGIYNVYVKTVHVRADRDWLHQVTVADTPGTNDPNSERDRITREWIQRADAVVYVTFAGQAGMDNEDVKFIDEHLAQVSPTHRIIAVNKCDDEPNTQAIWRHVHKIRDSGDLRMRNLFGNDDQIVLVSGLGALIAAMKDAGRPLSEDMNWHAHKMSPKGYLDAKQNGLDALRDLIERQIIANRGEGIIRAHRSRIANLLESSARRLAQNGRDLRHNLDAVTASSEEREKEQERLRRDILAIAAHVKRTKTDVSSDLDRLHSTLDQQLDKVAKRVKQIVEEALQGTTHVKVLVAQAQWGIQDALHSERSTIAEHVRELVKGVEAKLNDAESALSDEFMRSGFGTRVLRTHLMPVSARTICKDAEAELIAHLNRDGLAEVVRNSTSVWQRTFNTAMGKKAGIESLRPSLGEAFTLALETIAGHTERELKKLVDETVRSMEESCRDSLEKRKEQLEALEQKGASDDEMRERINRDLVDLAKQKRQVTELQEEYETAIAS